MKGAMGPRAYACFTFDNMGEAAVTSIYLFVAILVVSVVQEGLIRTTGKPRDSV